MERELARLVLWDVYVYLLPGWQLVSLPPRLAVLRRSSQREALEELGYHPHLPDVVREARRGSENQ